MQILNDEEIKALKYYEGDLTIQDTSDYFSNPKAYVTFNSLFFEGLETERARTNEGRMLDIAIGTNPQEVLHMSKNLISAMKKYPHDMLHTYRVERLVDYQEFKKYKMLPSFISTSTNGFLDAYKDKKDLVLMDIWIDSDALCIPYQEALHQYQKKEEGEVLLAPYAMIDIEELPISEEVKEIQDCNGNPPKVYCKVMVHGTTTQTYPEISLDKNYKEAVRSVYLSLNFKKEPQQIYIDEYLNYKAYLKHTFMKYLQNR